MRDGKRLRRGSTGEEIGHGGASGFRYVVVERISQDELDVGFIACQTERLSLIRSNEQIDYLNLLRFSFRVSLYIGAGGEDFDVLEQGLHSRSLGRIVDSGRVSGDEHINVHSWGDESSHADHLIDLDCGSSHSSGDGGGESPAGTGRGESVFKDRLTKVEIGDHAPAYCIFRFDNGTLGQSPDDVDSREIGIAQDASELDVARGGDDPCGCHMGSGDSVADQTEDDVAASGRDHKSDQ